MGRCHAHGGTEFSIGSCIPSKYMNQGKPLGSSFHQKSLPYQPNNFSLTIYSGSHGLGPWVTKIIPVFAGFLMVFLFEIWTHTLAFPYVSQGPLLKASKGHIKVLGPWCSSCYISFDRDPCCMSFGLTEILFFVSLLLLLFPSFWDFGLSWSFLTSWIGLSFVKAHGLSLLFMEWAFMWNFDPQQLCSFISFSDFLYIKSLNFFWISKYKINWVGSFSLSLVFWIQQNDNEIVLLFFPNVSPKMWEKSKGSCNFRRFI